MQANRNGAALYVSACTGLLLYFAYGFGSSKWSSIWLIATGLIVALAGPSYSAFINHVDASLSRRLNLVTMGKLGRFVVHMAYNVLLFYLLVSGGVVRAADIEGIGGTLGASLYTTLAAQGVQYMAVISADKGIGERNWNILVCSLMTTLVTAVAMLGHPEIQKLLTRTSLVLGALIFSAGLARDFRYLTVRTDK